MPEVTKYSIQSSTLQDIADAIREKKESSDPIAVSDFADEILTIQGQTIADENIFFANGTFYQTDKYQVTFSESGASYIDIIDGNIVVDIENQNEVSGFTVKSIESTPKEFFVIVEVTKTNPSFVGDAMQTGRCSLTADARLCMINGTGRYSYHNIQLQNNKTNYLIQNNVWQVDQSGIFICGHFFSISKMWLFTGYSFPYNN